MGLKNMEVELNKEQDIYFYLLHNYENSLYALGLNEDAVNREIAEFIQLGEIYKGK